MWPHVSEIIMNVCILAFKWLHVFSKSNNRNYNKNNNNIICIAIPVTVYGIRLLLCLLFTLNIFNTI